MRVYYIIELKTTVSS